MNSYDTCWNDQPLEWDEETDVLVVGSGFAGLTAAIEAKRAGARVRIIEKMKAHGGNSIICDGGIAAPGTDVQKKHGIEDSPEVMYKDMLRAGMCLNHPDLLQTLVDNAKDAFDWSREYLGVEYLDRIDIFGGHSRHRCHTAIHVSGATIINRMIAKVSELGMRVETQKCLEAFILDRNGRVCGAAVLEGYDHRSPVRGRRVAIKAEKGVLLATGGFSSDVGFRSAQDPRLTAAVDTTNRPHGSSEALKQALRIGALPVHLTHIQLGPWASPDEKGYGVGPYFSEYIVFQYGMVVNALTGDRFVNELADRKVIADSMLSIGRPCIGIADAMAVEISGWSIEKCLRKQIVKPFDSIDSLAAHYAVPIKALQCSIDRFNRWVKARHDGDFGKPMPANGYPIAHPPYYGIRLWPKVHHTMGGIGINRRAQVMDLDGKVLNGLYAAGEVTGGIHGASRLGSCAITDCLVFGRIAGRNLAAE